MHWYQGMIKDEEFYAQEDLAEQVERREQALLHGFRGDKKSERTQEVEARKERAC